MNKIWHVAAECAPIAKVGGLADVVGALPKYQIKNGLAATVLMPGYQHLLDRYRSQEIYEGSTDFAGDSMAYKVLELEKDFGFPVQFVIPAGQFDQPGIYTVDDGGHPFANECQRFPSFQAAVVNYLDKQDLKDSIVHIHDHHTALIPLIWLGKERPALVFTIHSAEYQGSFSDQVIRDLGVSLAFLPAHDYMSYGSYDINSMRVGVSLSDAVSTVSPSYANQLLDDPSLSHGLNDALRRNASKLRGVLNGIDPEVWSPEADQFIPHAFSRDNLDGKKANKSSLCEELGLDPELPLFVFVGRLKYEKGAQLLLEGLHQLKESGGFSCVVLGTGDEHLESEFRILEGQWRDRSSMRCILEFNNSLAHKLYASSDVLLMPSLVEPCGLNQMYAMRYGTIPLVHAVGGLKDSVEEWNEELQTGTGFKIHSASWGELAAKIIEVKHLYGTNSWLRLIDNAMEKDFSWARSVQDYIEIYDGLARD